MLMQARRQELLNTISKRTAQGTGVVPPPKRIALTSIKPETLNCLQPKGQKANAMHDPVPPPPPQEEDSYVEDTPMDGDVQEAASPHQASNTPDAVCNLSPL